MPFLPETLINMGGSGFNCQIKVMERFLAMKINQGKSLTICMLDLSLKHTGTVTSMNWPSLSTFSWSCGNSCAGSL